MHDCNRLQSVPVKTLLAEFARRRAIHILNIESFTNPSLAEFDDEVLVRVLKERIKNEDVEVIWGEDNRRDVFRLPASDQAIIKNVESVVALFHRLDILNNNDGTSRPRGGHGPHVLCPGQEFHTQTNRAFGSGVLVAPDIIATAAHNVLTSQGAPELHDIRLVFGFRMKNENEVDRAIPNTDIYSATEIMNHRYVEGVEDWALVRLNGTVTNRHIAPIRRTGRIADGQALYIIGHPLGLPAKYADHAEVIENAQNAPLFRATLDTLTGSSGSPVFNANSHAIEGIYFSGRHPLNTVGNCVTAVVCPSLEPCPGEACARTTLFAHLVPLNP